MLLEMIFYHFGTFLKSFHWPTRWETRGVKQLLNASSSLQIKMTNIIEINCGFKFLPFDMTIKKNFQNIAHMTYQKLNSIQSTIVFLKILNIWMFSKKGISIFSSAEKAINKCEKRDTETFLFTLTLKFGTQLASWLMIIKLGLSSLFSWCMSK